MVSDITNFKGRKLLNNILSGINIRYSTWNWPRCKIPKSWWKIWSFYLTNYIQPFLHDHPLGPWIKTSHIHSPWFITIDGQLFNTITNSLYSRPPNSHHRFVLNNTSDFTNIQLSYEVDVSIHDNTISIIATKDSKTYLHQPFFLLTGASYVNTLQILTKIYKVADDFFVPLNNGLINTLSHHHQAPEVS